MNRIDLDKIKSAIPEDLLRRVEEVEKSAGCGDTCPLTPKVAVFDMDNTLLIGDVGDAVFAQMLLDRRPLPFTWEEYENLIAAGHKQQAYQRVITAMAGLPLEDLLETTRQVLDCPDPYLQLGEVKVAIPRPNPVMQALLKLLAALGYKIYVISATNHYSVGLALEIFFAMGEGQYFGIKPKLTYEEGRDNGPVGPILGDQLEEPIAVGEGKAEIYRRHIGLTPPLITAGDSETDIPMLKLAHSRGLVIWVGADMDKFEKVKKEINRPGTLFHLP